MFFSGGLLCVYIWECNGHIYIYYIYIYINIHMVFPKMVVPLNHPKLDYFSIETYGFGDPPL